MEIVLPSFFIFDNTFAPLNSCERQLILDFHHSNANFSTMGYISRGKVRIEFDKTSHGQSIATFATEKYYEPHVFKQYERVGGETQSIDVKDYKLLLIPLVRTVDMFDPQ